MQELTLARTVTLAIFGASYLGLAVGRVPGFRVDRTGIAIIGGALMVVTGVLPWNDAVPAVDAHTLVLLFGMMIVAAYLRLSGCFSLVTLWAVRRAETPGEPARRRHRGGWRAIRALRQRRHLLSWRRSCWVSPTV
jgi:Na+/H+ antiporter NhaD/arsenite permease-like protein